MSATLFERLGGEAAIMAAVDLFYRKVLADEVTRPFFEDLDMEALSKKQVAFLAWAFGGPDEYKGRDLTVAHAKLVQERGLTDVHFDHIADHLRATLEDLGISDSLVFEVMGRVAPLRDAVLSR